MQALTENVAEIQLSYLPTNRLGQEISSSHDAYYELLKWFPLETISLQERFVALYLNRANRVLGAYLASSGGITGTVADPRLILSTALKVTAVGMVVAHNHPSGSLKPSQADIQLTQKIRDAGKLLDIQLVDHLIMTQERYYSFADEGMI